MHLKICGGKISLVSKSLFCYPRLNYFLFNNYSQSITYIYMTDWIKCGLGYFFNIILFLRGLCQGHALHRSSRRRWFIGRRQHQVAKEGPLAWLCCLSLSWEKWQRLMNNKQCEPAHLMFIYQLFGRPPSLTRVKSSLDMASLHRHTVDSHRSRGNRGSRTGTSPSGFGHS